MINIHRRIKGCWITFPLSTRGEVYQPVVDATFTFTYIIHVLSFPWYIVVVNQKDATSKPHPRAKLTADRCSNRATTPTCAISRGCLRYSKRHSFPKSLQLIPIRLLSFGSRWNQNPIDRESNTSETR